jgi:hypothetical protein
MLAKCRAQYFSGRLLACAKSFGSRVEELVARMALAGRAFVRVFLVEPLA